tara:strand:+ start:10355 stop:10648 length:294 start_codon:yes stop_codon:yes gene_type:complete
MHKWIVGIDPFDMDEQGWIIHRKPPEFIAKWTTEDEDTAVLSDLVYTDAAEETALAIYDFEWGDQMPSEKMFREVMAEGIHAIDEYLTTTLEMREAE